MEEEGDKNDVVYSSGDEGGTAVMSERVSNLANNIYREFERMIQKYDQEVVSGLMPLMVSVLEQLDSAYGDNNEQLIELEVLSDDNEQLITQYEREKQLRKLAENKYLEIEDQIEAEKRDAVKDIDQLEHENRGLEARVKSYQDHVERLEERMSEMKREYSTLHERHDEMVHHYMEKIERVERKGTGLVVGDTPQRAAARHRTLSGSLPRSPVGTPTRSEQELPPEALKSPDAEIPSPFDQPEDKNEMSLKEEQSTGAESPGSGSPSVRTVMSIGARSPTAHIASSTPELNSGIAMTSGSPDSSDIMGRGSCSSTESSGQNVDTSMCNLMDVDNIPIMTAKDAERMMLPGAPSSPNSSFSFLSKTAATIIATIPELDPQTQAAEVVRRSGVRRGAGRPISLDLETLPEGVSADSLFMELSNQEPDSIGDVDTGADITAMGRELETVMKENKDLLAAKNKLLTQKNDLLKRLEEISSEKEVLKDELMSSKYTKGHMSSRVIEVEQELKRVNLEAEKANVALKEASHSAAHRKRFTRVEMARVLMERNQYKERLMELQEAVRWTEMIRASKEKNLELQQKKKSSIWKFSNTTAGTFSFSNLFGPAPKKPIPQTVSIRYNSPAQGDEQEASARQQNNLGAPGGGGFGSENFDRQRLVERRERYRQVRAYLNTDPSEGRMQAYGWSLPAKYSSELAEGGKSLVSVPVPVYCRPLNLNDPGMKIWCAAGVDLTGGQTQDGGSAVGASVFYAGSCRQDGEEQEQEESKGEVKESKPSMVWIGSSTHSCSKITVVDANYPQNILDCFMICTSHLLCITAIPGACQADYDTDTDSIADSIASDSTNTDQQKVSSTQAPASVPDADFADPLGAKASAGSAKEPRVPTVTDISTSENDLSRSDSAEKLHSISSVLPTMWLGAQSGCVYVHSAVSQWRTCIHSVRLKDSVLSIVHVKGRVLVALADGTVAIFHRASDGQWNFNNYHLLDLGRPHHSIRCMSVVHAKVWCGYRNKIQVIHPRSMRVEKTFDAHPRRESQVRQLAWIGDGVWVSIRLDSTLRLYNAHTYHHLQDIDIEPYVSKMLGTGKLGFSFVRITSLNLTNDRLWVGTGNGVILSVPLVAARPVRDDRDELTSSPGTGGPGGPVRVYSNEGKDGEPPSVGSSFMPYCSMVNAQLSFHGHRDSVKFFVAVPGSVKRVSAASKQSNSSQTATSSSPEKSKKMMLVLSGGEGYVDFRLGDGEETALEEQGGDLITVTAKSQSTNMRSHIMVWQVAVN